MSFHQNQDLSRIRGEPPKATLSQWFAGMVECGTLGRGRLLGERRVPRVSGPAGNEGLGSVRRRVMW
jgi:hypothetical protein